MSMCEGSATVSEPRTPAGNRPLDTGDPGHVSTQAEVARQPIIDGNALRVFYPTPTVWRCPVAGCDTTYGCRTWTTNRVSLVKHLERHHGLTPIYELVCGACEEVLGRLPSRHECAGDLRADDRPVARRQPQLIDNELRLYWPLPHLITCAADECSARFGSIAWTMTKQSLCRHLEFILDIRPEVVTECVGCGSTLGLRPSQHECRVTVEGDNVGEEDAPFKYAEPGCGRAFPLG